MKRIAVVLAAAMLLGFQMAGCSGGEAESKKDEKPVTRQVADEAAREMRAPLQKARDVKQQAEKRLDEMGKTLKE